MKSRGSPLGELDVSKEEGALFWPQVTLEVGLSLLLTIQLSSNKTDTVTCLVSFLGSIFQFGSTKKDGKVSSPYQDPKNIAKSN